MTKEAMLYREEESQKTACELCHHRCLISPSKFGVCGVRQNKDGKLFTLVYGEVIAAHVDPIEKKPLFHFLPGSLSFSVATIGCNFRCSFCQNWQISQQTKRGRGNRPEDKLTPDSIVKAALDYDCRSLSFTYTEPTVYFEYAYDTARLAHESGLKNVFVTNGYMTQEALDVIHPYLDGCNVDLKSFRGEFYKTMCQGRLEPVLESIRLMRQHGIWIEITTLVIPGQNDSNEELAEIAEFISQVSPDIPWHISRFHPDHIYRESEPTPVETLRRARSIGREAGLRFVYVGNVWGESEDTHCPFCSKAIIRRRGFDVRAVEMDRSRCSYCKRTIAGVFE